MSLDHSRQAMRLFNALMHTGELSQQDNPELFAVFYDEEVFPYINVLKKEMNFTIKVVSNERLYLIPGSGNEILGMSGKEIISQISAIKNKRDLYLFNYIIITIFSLLYNPNEGMTVRPYQTFLPFSLIEDKIEERLKNALERVDQNELLEDVDLENEALNLSEVVSAWRGRLKSKEKGDKSSVAFIKTVLNFLESQGLVIRDSKHEGGERIEPTNRLTALIEHISFSEREKILNLMMMDPIEFEDAKKQLSRAEKLDNEPLDI